MTAQGSHQVRRSARFEKLLPLWFGNWVRSLRQSLHLQGLPSFFEANIYKTSSASVTMQHLEPAQFQLFQTAENMVGSDESFPTVIHVFMQLVQERIRGHTILFIKNEYLEALLDKKSIEEMAKNMQVLIRGADLPKDVRKPEKLQGEPAFSFFSRMGLTLEAELSQLYVMVNPLISGGRLLGVLCLYRETPFSEDETADLTLFSIQVANTIYLRLSKLKEKEFEIYKQIETSDDFLLLLDDKGGIIHANKEAAALLGYSAGEMDGMPLEKFLPSEGIAHREGLSSLEKGSSVKREFLHKNGTRVLMEVSSVDISDHTLYKLIPAGKGDQFLRDYYEVMIHTTEDMIFIMDLNGIFVYVNRKAADVMGEDVVGKSFEEVVVPQYRGLAREEFEKRTKGITSPMYQIQVFSKTGEPLWLEINGAPLFHHGKVVGSCGSARNITDKMRLEKQRVHLTSIANDILQRRNLDEILDTVASAIRDHCGFGRVIIFLLDEAFEATNLAFAGLTQEEKTTALQSHLSPEQRKSILQERFKIGQSYYIRHDQTPWGKTGVESKLKPEQMKDWHPDDFLFIPLYGEKNKVIGLISVDDPAEGKAPTAEDLAPVELFATQAAIAIENARLYRQISQYAELMESKVRERTRKREALLETSYRLREVTSWENGMQIILEGAAKGLGFENLEIFLINEARGVLENIVATGGEKKEEIPLNALEYVAAQCVAQKKPIDIQHASTDSRVKKQIEPIMESFAWVPIMIQDEVLGAISGYNKTSGKPISYDELDDLMLFANQAASFVESTRFLITPAVENTLSSTMKYHLEAGESFLFESKQSTEAFDAFIDAVTHGIEGFSICRMHPQKVRRRYELKKTPILWLSTSGAEDSLDPKDLAKINHLLNEFLRRATNSVILLEGIEYLIIQNSFEKVIKTLHSLNDHITMSNSRLLLPVDPNTLSEKEMSILKKEFRIFKQ